MQRMCKPKNVHFIFARLWHYIHKQMYWKYDIRIMSIDRCRYNLEWINICNHTYMYVRHKIAKCLAMSQCGILFWKLCIMYWKKVPVYKSLFFSFFIFLNSIWFYASDTKICVFDQLILCQKRLSYTDNLFPKRLLFSYLKWILISVRAYI